MLKMEKISWSRLIAVFLLIAVMSANVAAYKILMVPAPAKSHIFSMLAMAQGVVNRGHMVTFLVGENFKLYLQNLTNAAEFAVMRYNDATSDGIHLDYEASHDYITKTAIESGGDISKMLPVMRGFLQQWCQYVAIDNRDSFEKLEREKFDLAIIDGVFMAKCLYLIPHRLQIPWITYSDGVDPLVVRVPWLPSFVPGLLFPFSEQMTFIERLKNTAAVLLFSFILPLEFPDPAHEVLENFRRYGYFKSLDELAAKSALWLNSKDDVLDYPRPWMPNIISVGGLTVNHSTAELPDDIKNFIDGARKGVILVTFGSVVSNIPAHAVEKFSSVFRRLDGYRVVWRLSNKDGVKLPKNVMIAQWLPQSDILSHPSVKLFITHCGNTGQYEAVYHGVPMIGFPFFADQPYNARRLEHRGFGLSMNFLDFTADQLFDNIHKILGDKSYKERVMKASEIFRSQAQSPVERAAFWIEHVCRFGGDHLRSAGNDLPLYSYLMLDILAFVLVILHVLIYLLYRFFYFYYEQNVANPQCRITQ